MAGSHNRAVPSAPAVARILPPGLNDNEFTAPAVAISGAPPRCWPVATAHSHTAPPAPAAARVLPSGLNVTEYTAPPRTRNGAPLSRWVATFHNRAVPS